MQSLDEIWELTLEHMRKELSETAMQLWFNNMKIVELNENDAVLLCETNFKRNTIEKRHMEKLKINLSKTLGFDVNIKLVSKEMDLSEQRIKDDLELIEKDGEPEEISESSSLLPRQQKSIEYTFENFIVGSSNKFAHAASMAVANNPGYEYNPLFIYGASGLGKTHLLYAISNKIMEKNPNTNIILVKGEEFTNQIIESIRLGLSSTSQFKNKYRKADVLLIDDIQFIAGKDSTQEEFFHTFNALYEEDKQIVLTSDRPPKDIKTLEDRLKTRFEWGLPVDVQPPDYELRIAIMQNKAQHLGLVVPNDVLNFLAENLHSNVRQLEGAIKKIGAQSYLNKVDITLELAINCTSDLFSGSEPVSVTIGKILDKVSAKYGITADDLKGKKRNKEIVNPRHIAVFITRKLTELSLPAIAKIFDRDHTTIMASLKNIEDELKVNSLLEIEINELIKEIKE